MSHLISTLYNSTRPLEFRIQRESMFVDHLLSNLHTKDNVISLKEQFYMGSSNIWTKHYREAFNYASKGIRRKEYKPWIFTVSIE